MKDFVLEFVGKHTDGHFDRDLNDADGIAFNGKRQIMQFSFDTDWKPNAPENIAAGLRAKNHPDGDVEVLLHDAETYLAWLEKTAKRVRKGLRNKA